MQHIHYGDWTIEYVRGDGGEYNVYICIKLCIPRSMSFERYCYWVMKSTSSEDSIKECKDLIDKITARQNRVIMTEILSLHDKHKPKDTPEQPPAFDAEDRDDVPF
jgi:hypothetical protein